MTHHWDEFAKSLAEESVPRRESLRRLGAVLAGAVLAPAGLSTVWARPPADPCKAFCNQCPKQKRSQCLTACQACNGDTSRLCGSCGSYACCGGGSSCCGNYCADLANDIYNCGECGYDCHEPGPYEEGACVDGACLYQCIEGAVRCNGACTFLDWDQNNCGACGNICEQPGPYEYGSCINGTCEYACNEGAIRCGGTCTDLNWDPNNCGACGNVCGGGTPYCNVGTCAGAVQCFGGQALCGGVCREIQLDPSNCGACGVQCGPGENCAGGLCQSAE